MSWTEKCYDVEKFLGIKYASIPARFRTAVPVEFEGRASTLNAHTYGPRCPQPIDYPREKRHHLYAGIEPSSDTPVDEFDCLTLNIYKPSNARIDQNTQKANLLPVLVWIHGGGWTVGDANSEYDGSFLVQHSLTINKPFVFVSINYRLGYYGFLTSQELQVEEASASDKPEGQKKGRWNNQGLHDQRLALLWIQQYISQFGGDPNRVTLAGESAGAWCVMAHLQADVCLFQRAIVMSCPKVTLSSFEDAQRTFDELVQRFGCKLDATAEEKLRVLRSVSYEELETALDGKIVRLITEPQLFGSDRGGFNFPAAAGSKISFPHWIQGVVIGTTRDECALWISKNDQDLVQDENFVAKIPEAVRRAVPDLDLAKEICDAYGISDTYTVSDPSKAITAVQKLASDALFDTVPQIVANNASRTPTRIYSFDQTDEYENSPFRGDSYHSLDNVFFCRLPVVTELELGASIEIRKTVDMFSAAILTFLGGEMPWNAYNSEVKGKSRGVFVFNGHESRLVQPDDKQVQANNTRWTPFITTTQRETMFTGIWRELLGLVRKS